MGTNVQSQRQTRTPRETSLPSAGSIRDQQRLVEPTRKEANTAMRIQPTLTTLMVILLGSTLVGCGSSEPTTGGPAAETSAVSNSDATSPATATPAQPAKAVADHRPDPQFPIVEVKTSHGTLILKLNAEKAPITVRNFLSYVEDGHYNGTIFHQVDQGYMILGGGYTAEMEEKEPRTAIFNEAANGLKNKRGTIAMARSPGVIDSATCQFFLNVVDNPNLDHTGREEEKYGYCVFGEVISGMEVVEKIAGVPAEPDSGRPKQTVLIEKATLIR